MKGTDDPPKREKCCAHGHRKIMDESDAFCLSSSEATYTGAITRGPVI
jgi:hypothetical protein